MSVRIRLREVSAYSRLKMEIFSRKITGTAVWCPRTGGVRLWAATVSGGLTVHCA